MYTFDIFHLIFGEDIKKSDSFCLKSENILV